MPAGILSPSNCLSISFQIIFNISFLRVSSGKKKSFFISFTLSHYCNLPSWLLHLHLINLSLIIYPQWELRLVPPEYTSGFLMFSEGIERDQLHEMDWWNHKCIRWCHQYGLFTKMQLSLNPHILVKKAFFKATNILKVYFGWYTF